AMVSILAVFIPSFFMQGSAQGLFVPLSLAVGFAMITSYLLSSTFVPVLSVWLLRTNHRDTETQRREEARITSEQPLSPKNLFSSTLCLCVSVVRFLVRLRWAVVPVYLVSALLLVFFLGRQLGTEIFPQVDAGQFQFRLRAPDGTRIEQTEAIT